MQLLLSTNCDFGSLCHVCRKTIAPRRTRAHLGEEEDNPSDQPYEVDFKLFIFCEKADGDILSIIGPYKNTHTKR